MIFALLLTFQLVSSAASSVVPPRGIRQAFRFGTTSFGVCFSYVNINHRSMENMDFHLNLLSYSDVLQTDIVQIYFIFSSTVRKLETTAATPS